MVTLLPFSHDSAGWLRFLLEVSARGAVVLALTAAVCLALRRASAAVRHLLWTLAIICLLCLPLLSLLLPAWRVRGVPRLPAPSAGPVHQPFAQPEPGGDARIAALTAAATSLKSSAAPTVTAKRTRGAVERPASGRFPRERIPSLALAVWALGAAIALLPALVGLVCMTRLVRRARPVVDDSWRALMRDASAQLRLRRPVRLMCSPLDTVPMICGWRRPVLLLPAGADGWTDERRRLVLLHELAHVKRVDCLIQMLGQLACALHWFNPLAWLAGNQLRRQGEQACDDLVLASGFKGSSYAGHLLEIANTLRRPAFLQAAAVAMARPSGLEGRIRAVLDPTRSRQALSRRAAVVAALATAVLLGALATVHGADAGAPNAIPPHGAEREPWQSWITKGGYDPDRRLEQPLRIEILGRSAVSTLALLSEQTGVALQVAPEDVETLGDRKLTIIAQGCSLKGIMVQIPKALQECHWDINTHGPQPVYLLHRNSGAEATMAELAAEGNTRWQEERRPAREARLAEASKALAMSPEELAELAKTDPLLAATVKDPAARKRLELLLNLPAKDMQDFVTMGRAYMPYQTAPATYQEAARQSAESFVKESATSDSAETRGWAKILPDLLPTAAIYYEDYGEAGVGPGIQCFDVKGAAGRRGDFLRLGMGGTALPPRLLADPRMVGLYRKLLVSTGMEENAAEATLTGLVTQFQEQQREQQDRKRSAEWREPRSPQLHKIVTLPFKDDVDKVEMQRFIAKETGLSLVSDYFTTWGSGKIPDEAKAAMPMWRILYLLSESWYWSYDWNEAGDCLVLHDKLWYISAPQEFPESMVLAYREKLKRQGRFTLDDVVSAAVELARRRPVPPRQRGEWPWSDVNVPSDLREAGLSGPDLRSEALLLYATLTPEQREKARSQNGLPYAEMTPKQQNLVAPYAFFEGGWSHDKHALPEEEISQAVYRVKQSARKVRLESGEMFELKVDFPSLDAGVALWLRTASPSPPPAAAGRP